MSMIESICLIENKHAALPDECVIALGNFDGVHLAHRALLRLAKKMRDESFPNAACTVFCFREPSSDFLSDASPAHLSTLAQKLEYFREEGVEYVFLVDFPTVKNLSPDIFATELLQGKCRCVAAVCGFNYRFGKDGAGTAKQLSTLLSCPVLVQNEISVDGETVSSTRIRKLLLEGCVKDAAALLTRPYVFSANVVHGKSLGHKLDAPTINQFFPSKMLIPRHGVYLTACEVDGRVLHGVSNVGVHPTVDADAKVNCETYLLDFSGDLYGKSVRISFLKFLRPEQKFNDEAALRQQIHADIEAARNNF